MTVNRLKYWIKILLGQKLYFPRQLQMKTLVMGESGGAFPILSHPETPGSSNPSDVAPLVYSFGIGENLSFSQDILDMFPQARTMPLTPHQKLFFTSRITR